MAWLVVSGLLLLPCGDLLARQFVVASGQVHSENKVLVAGEDGATLKFQQGVVVTLSPGSKLRKHKDTKLWLTTSGRTNTYVFTLLRGRADVTSPVSKKRSRWTVLVRTSFKLMGALDGGTLTALAGREHGVIAAESGAVSASDGGRFSPVAAGEMVAITPKKRGLVGRRLPAAPSLFPTRSVWLSLGKPATVGGFKWSPVADAEQYRVTLHLTGEREPMFQQVTQVTQLPALFKAVSAGSYQLRVRSLDRYGLAGPASEPHQFNVIGVETSDGSRVDARGVIHVGISQQARFTHVEGLLMTYGQATRWVKATSSVPLRRRERTTVHFRYPEREEIVSARLEPRGVRADVYVGKKTATWPKDTLDVVVRLVDDTGSGSVAEIVPTIDVRVGLDPLNLDWKREGYVYRARVKPRAGTGPWVVRATVTDQFGVELGRDFVEVTSSGKRKSKNRSSRRTSVGGRAR